MPYMDKRNAARLVNDYADMIMRIGLMYLKQTYDAEDICQEVFIKLMSAELTFEDREHEKAWIIRTTINTCKDRKKLAFYRYWSGEPKEELVSGDDFTGNDLLEEIKKLAKWQRVAIYLYYYEEYSTAEIAMLTGRTKSSVQKDLSRGRKFLKNILESEYGKDYGFEKGGADYAE